ncbi:hypothetical protein SpCBS45565_g03152 [Spizellomyces sp. 'palustris']|nr:hypothetical protein SpCBS45565_g03152 [Spizellomyces sp. 'palustris']
MPAQDFDLIPFVRSIRLNHPKEDYEELMDAIVSTTELYNVLFFKGSARVVCIGDGSHGTLEFYRERAYITQRLIAEKGFNAVVAEADWPDAITINRYVQNTSKTPIKGAVDALKDFKRFPLWMWRNEVMVPFVKWLRLWNDKIAQQGGGLFDKACFFGMDMYSLHASAAAVIEYLQKVDPKAAQKARERYGCFHRFGTDTTKYAFAVRYGISEGCGQEAVKVLQDLLEKRLHYVKENCNSAEEEQFIAEMNALVVKDAEEYYRCMLDEDVITWNLRDQHMVNTLERVMDWIDRHKSPDQKSKVVVWAHNSHLGDARHTDMGRRRGEVNVGQLCREKFGEDNVFNIGFTTYKGTVTAAHEWDTPGRIMDVNPGRNDAIEGLMERSLPHIKNCLLLTHRIDPKTGKKIPVDEELNRYLDNPMRLERFIGVIYRPATERWSHYSSCALASQFDALAHLRVTNGIRPLDKTAHFPDASPDVPETFPFAM